VFALSTGNGPAIGPAELLNLGNAAADCLARAIMRAVIAAEPLGGFAAWRQLWGRGPA
jgi:L-aminopeptidase/D-esterase-like protein